MTPTRPFRRRGERINVATLLHIRRAEDDAAISELMFRGRGAHC